LRFRVDVAALRATFGALNRWGQGRTYKHFRHAQLQVDGEGILRITYTSELGTAFLSCDAEVETPGECGVDVELFCKFLSPYKGKGWELQLSFEPDPKTEDRHLVRGQFFEGGCKRNQIEWPFVQGAASLFCSSDWVPQPVLASGVVREFRVPRPRLLQLLSSGGAAHTTVEKSVQQLHSAGLSVAADVASVFTANAAWGIRSQLWADGELGFDTGWAGEPQSLSVDAESLLRSQVIVDAFGGVDAWVIQVPESGPLKFCPAAAPEEAWVSVKEAEDPIALPELLDQLRAAKPSKGVTKLSGTIPLNRRIELSLRSVLLELEALQAYRAVDSDADCWTVSFESDALVLEVPSQMHIGAVCRLPWRSPPKGELVRCISGVRLQSLLKALTANTEPDGEIEVCFWADEAGDLERFYFASSSPKGNACDAVLMPMSRAGGPVRVADMAAQEVAA